VRACVFDGFVLASGCAHRQALPHASSSFSRPRRDERSAGASSLNWRSLLDREHFQGERLSTGF